MYVIYIIIYTYICHIFFIHTSVDGYLGCFQSLPLSAKQMDLEGIVLYEITQRKCNTLCSHLYVESKKRKEKKLIDTGNRMEVVRYRGGSRGEIDGGGEKVQTSSYKVNKKSWVCKVQHGDKN